MRLGKILTALAAAFAVVVTLFAPASADEGWHSVDEGWERYQQGELFLPAARYCGDFHVQTSVVRQGIRSRVLSRWDAGGARETVYDGPLIMEAINTSTGTTVRLNLSGRAETLQRPDGALARYESLGPVGFGWPTGSVGLAQGFYVFRGRHVVEFPESGPRRLVVDQGPEMDVCAALR